MEFQVEKTSKRGGRIIHERDIMMPPPAAITPPPSGMELDPAKPEPTITEILKAPSKVVLLRVSYKRGIHSKNKNVRSSNETWILFG